MIVADVGPSHPPVERPSVRWEAAGGYTPVCSCGWEGKERRVRSAAASAVRAHAQSRGCHRQPPV